MLFGIIILTLTALLAVLSHRSTRLEEKIYKSVPVSDWLAGFIFPLILYLGWVFIAKNIMVRSRWGIIPFDDFDILSVSFIFLAVAFIGNSLHFTAKILWRYLKGTKTSMAYRVNEMFHNKLSHYMVYVSSIMFVFMLAILEVNHPSASSLNQLTRLLIVISGLFFGISSAKSVFYMNQWFGGYIKPISIILMGFLFTLLWMFRELRLNLDYYPASLFVVVVYLFSFLTFVSRTVALYMHFGRKKRLKIIARILSV